MTINVRRSQKDSERRTASLNQQLRTAQATLLAPSEADDAHRIRLAISSLTVARRARSHRVRRLAIEDAEHLLSEASEPRNPMDRHDYREGHQIVLGALSEVSGA